MDVTDLNGSTVRADPQALAGAGKIALDFRQIVLATSGTLETAANSAAGGLSGWQTASALTRLAQVWEKQSDALAERLGRTGGNLETTAQQYRSTEAANQAAFEGR
ncbi:hypothetical protein ACGFZP_31470 [Kitasatospora sp. NPDC048239]|uniref:hypothetical protein n=1 Tax=unclassified Kitasatospora TaxID=2633591 RepID=UPI00371FD093